MQQLTCNLAFYIWAKSKLLTMILFPPETFDYWKKKNLCSLSCVAIASDAVLAARKRQSEGMLLKGQNILELALKNKPWKKGV